METEWEGKEWKGLKSDIILNTTFTVIVTSANNLKALSKSEQYISTLFSGIAMNIYM